MKLAIKNKELNDILKLQQGGEMVPVEPTAPAEPEAPQGGQDPLMELAQASMQAIQTQDCNLAMQVCQAFVQLVQGSAQPEQAPADQAPVYRAGGKFSRWIKK